MHDTHDEPVTMDLALETIRSSSMFDTNSFFPRQISSHPKT